MHRASVFFLAAAFVAALGCSGPQEQDDHLLGDPLKGTWVSTQLIANGVVQGLPPVKWVFNQGSFTVYNKAGGVISSGTYLYDGAGKVNFTSAGVTSLAIYGFVNSKVLQLCIAQVGQPRPTQFASPTGSWDMFWTLLAS